MTKDNVSVHLTSVIYCTYISQVNLIINKQVDKS
jgi:hypothetical protein